MGEGRSSSRAQTDDFAAVRRELERWRSTRSNGSRIPEPLWASAARLAVVRARTLLVPGMKGTPERDWYLLKHDEGAAAHFDKQVSKHIRRPVETKTGRGIEIGQIDWDCDLIREFHEVFPQVITPDMENERRR